jgi:hypothetical protein
VGKLAFESRTLYGSMVGGEKIQQENFDMSLKQETNESATSRIADIHHKPQIDKEEEQTKEDIVETNESTKSTNNMFGVSATENLRDDQIATQARDWFTSLSSEERSGATSFSDEAFLGAFLALATTTGCSTTASNTHVNGSGGSNAGEYRTNYHVDST